MKALKPIPVTCPNCAYSADIKAYPDQSLYCPMCTNVFTWKDLVVASQERTMEAGVSSDMPLPKKSSALLALAPTPKMNTLNPQLDLLTELKKRIIGQDHVMDDITSTFYRWEIGLNPEGTPAGSFLFLGPTGTGKTRTIEALAEIIHNDPKGFIKIDCAEFQHSHEIAKLLGCFTPDTQVLLSNGFRCPIVDIEIGDLVLSKDGKPHRVLDTYEYDCDGEILEIRVAGQSEPVKVTPGHLVWAKRGFSTRPTTKAGRDLKKTLYSPEGLDYVAAGTLQTGDIVVYPRMCVDESKRLESIDLANYVPIRTQDRWIVTETTVGCKSNEPLNRFIKVNQALARIAGYYVSEGGNSIDRASINFTFALHERSMVNDLIRCLREVFGEKLHCRVHVRDSSLRVYVSSILISQFMAEHFGDHAARMRLPEWILHERDEVVWDLLDGMFLGDGGKTVSRRLDYSTISPTLASQTELLIKRLGYICQVQMEHHKNPEWSDRYRLYVSGAQIDNFLENLKLTKEIASAAWGKSQRRSAGIQRNQGIDEQYVYSKILSIKSVQYSGKVYDFAVEDAANYVLCFAAHNSPPGYLGHRETHPALTQAKLNSHFTEMYKCSFLLLDEIEKASDALWNLLLGILDKATLTLGDNSKVDFSQTFIFMTSNLGAREMQEAVEGSYGFHEGTHGESKVSQDKLDKIAREAARRKFTPEFMNRIDTKVVYRTLSRESLSLILDQQLFILQKRILNGLGAKGFVLDVLPEAREFLLKVGVSKVYGARELKRAIETHLNVPLVHQIRQDPEGWSDLDSVEVSVVNGVCKFKKIK